MRKNFMKCIAATAAAAVGIVSTTFPVRADSSLKSSGNLVYEEEAVSLCAADVAWLYAEAEAVRQGQELSELPAVSLERPARKDKILSKGAINYADGEVVMDSSDLVRLADQLDGLDAAYRNSTAEAAGALSQIGTYFTKDGSVTHIPEEAGVGETASELPYHKICEGILKSQSVAHLEDQKIGAAVANNLSRDTAAWVDGKLIVGNGADNDAHYESGYTAGEASGYQTGYAAGIKEAETNVNTSSASYREGYARGKADAAPVVLTGTITDLEASDSRLKGSVQIPTGLTYVCAGMCVSESVACVYPAVNMWSVNTGWDYNSETGLVTFRLDMGGEKHPSSSPDMSYTIMYIP